MQRLTLGGLDLSVIDPHERDTLYIYEEVFRDQIYYHEALRLPRHPVVFDVGANIGLFSIWAARRFQPRAIHAYEASPRTFAYYQDNAARQIDAGITKVHGANRAVTARAGESVTLHQAPFTSGLSTLLPVEKLEWLANLDRANEIERHEVRTVTLSGEFAAHRLERIDLLKIDVEGFFLEVLGGLSDADYGKVRNIVVEVEYSDAVGSSPAEVAAILAARGYQTEIDGMMLYAWRG